MARNPKRRFAPLAVADMPRFSGISTFMRLPAVEDPAEVDIALVGVPFDLGTTNRPGTRHGPRALREASTLMRNVHPVTGVAPYALCAVADLGDVSINPTDLAVSLERIEAAFARIHGAGATTLAAGGDHLISLPILRGLARHRPAGTAVPGMIHIDAHSDTTDSYFHGTRL